MNGRTMVAPESSGHIHLSRGKSVDYAGTLHFGRRANSGQLRSWTNNSGHYRPTRGYASQANLPLNKFRPID